MRAGVFASVCVVLSLIGHDLMAGHRAPAWAGWAAVAGVTVIGYSLADRRRPAWWILLAVEVVQVCLHAWFAWATPADPGSVSVHTAVTMHGGAHTVVTSAGAVPMSHGAGMSGTGMVGAHALAGALVAFWLSVGERVAWRTLGVIAGLLLGPALRVLAVLVLIDPAAGLRTRLGSCGRDEGEVRPVGAVLRHVLVRRGPPWGVGAVSRTHV